MIRQSAGAWMLAAAVLSGCTSASTALPAHELSMRFTHPELYEGRDAFARPNALREMLDSGALRRGMTDDEVQSLLGVPDSCLDSSTGEQTGSITIGKPFTVRYDHLESSNFWIEFDGAWKVQKMTWTYDEGPYVDRVDVW